MLWIIAMTILDSRTHILFEEIIKTLFKLHCLKIRKKGTWQRSPTRQKLNLRPTGFLTDWSGPPTWNINLIIFNQYHHLVLWLVFLVIDVFHHASGCVHRSAHPLRLAHNARILCSPWFAALCGFCFYQTLRDQLVAGNLKVVEVPNTYTAFEETAILGARSRKFTDFLESRVWC